MMCVLIQVVILYFHPSVFRCVLLRWVRLLGFAIMYGTVVLKLYRYCQTRGMRDAKILPLLSPHLLLSFHFPCSYLLLLRSSSPAALDVHLQLTDLSFNNPAHTHTNKDI